MAAPEDRLITLFRKTLPLPGHRIRLHVDDTADRFRRMPKPDRVLVFRLLVARWYLNYRTDLGWGFDELSAVIDNEFAAHGDRVRDRAIRIWVCKEGDE